MRHLWLLFVGLSVAGGVDAAVIVGWDFTGAPGDQLSTAPAVVAESITGLDVTRGSGITPSAQANSISSTGWSLFDFGYASDYYQFGFVTGGGKAVNLSQIRLAHATSHGITWQLRSSLDGYVGTVTSFSSMGSVNYTDISLPPSFSGLSGTIGFRLYGYWVGNANGSAWLLNSVYGNMMTINGTVIPEPATMGVLGLLGIGCLSRRPRAL